jgi:putative protein kinase ArgK-like GTPase of G3E family
MAASDPWGALFVSKMKSGDRTTLARAITILESQHIDDEVKAKKIIEHCWGHIDLLS